MRKETKMTLNELKCNVINTFGDGQHPFADENTVDYFNSEYVLELIEKAIYFARKSSVKKMLKELKKVEEKA